MQNELLNELIEDLKNEKSFVKLRAIDELTEINTKKSFEILVNALLDDDEEIVFKASLALRNCPAKIHKNIINLFGNNNWKIRENASKLLIDLENSPVNSLLEYLKKDIDHNVSFWIIKTLGELGDSRAVSGLLNILKQGNQEEKIAAVTSLSHIREKKAVLSIIDALVDDNWHVRKTASISLMNMGELVVPELVSRLDTDNEDLFFWSTKILGELKAIDAVHPLIKILNQVNDNEKKELIIKILGKIGDESSVDHLIAKLGDDSWTMRKYAAESLLSIGEDGINKLTNNYDTGNADMRYWIVWILGNINKLESIRLLERSLKDEKWFVRSHGVSSLGNLKSYSSVIHMLELIYDENPEVRKSCLASLNKLERIESLEYLKIYISTKENDFVKIAEEMIYNIQNQK